MSVTSSSVAQEAQIQSKEGEPIISVLIPEALHDPRRDARFVRSWAREQVVSDSSFEVIVAMREGNREEEESVRGHLRPDDEFILGPFDSCIQCYNAAAKRAKGQFLLLTENHTIADRECLGNLISYLDRTGVRAAFLTSHFRNHGHLDEQEEILYRSYLEEKWTKEGQWDRVRLRGAVLEKSLYEELGGLREDYGLFSEEHMASMLSRAGVRVGHAEDAAVVHVNAGSFSHLQDDIVDFAHGECVFRDKEYDDSQAVFFGEPEIWRHRAIHLPGMRRRLARTYWRMIRASLCAGGREQLRLAAAAIPRGALLGVSSAAPETFWPECLRISVQWHRFCAFLFQHSESWGLRAFERMWQAVRRLTHRRYFARHPEPEGYELPEGLEFSRATPAQLYGFHPREVMDGRSFRWTEPLAAIRLRLEPGEYEVAIDTGAIRDWKCDFPFSIAFNGRMVIRSEKSLKRNRFRPAIARLKVKAGVIRFKIKESWFVEGEQLLTLFSVSLRRNEEERRRLALPIRDIRFSRIDEGTKSG